MIAGFIAPSAGRLLIDNEDVTRVPPQKRAIGMVFQDYALFPHLTVAENIAFGLVERRRPAEAIVRRVKELLDLVHLPLIGDRYPSEISGGQQQRVALARAVAHTPRVLLMDEPLGALDLKLREAMQFELRRIQQELGITTVYVTHDQHEAMSLSDRIAVMNNGLIEQLDAPKAIYDAPRTHFTAAFVGKINFFAGTFEHAGPARVLATPQGRFRLPESAQTRPDRGATLAVRPESMSILKPGEPTGDRNAVEGTLQASSFVGNLRHYMVRLPGDLVALAEARGGEADLPAGAPVRLAWDVNAATILPEQPQPGEPT
jgi:ABC-type Fe3+/spermidine/putrescine transport system ATPase subunit